MFNDLSVNQPNPKKAEETNKGIKDLTKMEWSMEKKPKTKIEKLLETKKKEKGDKLLKARELIKSLEEEEYVSENDLKKEFEMSRLLMNRYVREHNQIKNFVSINTKEAYDNMMKTREEQNNKDRLEWEEILRSLT